MTGICSSLRCFWISGFVWYLAPSSKSTVSFLQCGLSASSCIASFDRYSLKTSASVLTYVKEPYTSPSVSIASIRLTLGCTCFSAIELVDPWALHFL